MGVAAIVAAAVTASGTTTTTVVHAPAPKPTVTKTGTAKPVPAVIKTVRPKSAVDNPGGPAPSTSTNAQGCYYVKMGDCYCPSTGTYIPMQDPNG